MSTGVGFKSPEKARLVQQIVTEAIATKDLKTAVAKQGKLLTPEENKALQSLTPAELNALASVNAKLGPLGISSLY